MNTFQFLAKQNQHHQIARLLTAEFNKPRLAPYNGPRGQGVMITMVLPSGVSRRMVNRFLHLHNVLGSVSCRNRFRVFNMRQWRWQLWNLSSIIGPNEFIAVTEGGQMRRARLERHFPNCTCCGPYLELVFTR